MAVTCRAAVLGKPIAHSLSPVLHNAAYEALELPQWSYGKHEVGDADLADFLRSLDAGTWRGLSLTMPLKKQILSMGTTRDKWSRYLKVANTVVFKDVRTPEDATNPAHLDLYNTDVFGIEAALNDVAAEGTDEPTMETLSLSRVSKERSCVVIGSGSTAASAIAALSELGATRIAIAARNQQKAAPLLNICRDLGIEGSVSDLSDVPMLLADAQYAISTIPAHAADGIAHAMTQRLGNASHAKEYSDLTLLDVVYDPRPTDLMTVAAQGGATCVGGEHMLLWQAVVQVALMTGIDQRRVPVAAMREELKRAMEEK